MKATKVILILLISVSALFGADIVKIERMSMELAMEVAKKSVESCRKKGYWVSAVVVDRSANVQVTLRDTHAARFTMEIAEQKANLVIMSGINSSDFVPARSDIRNELNNISGLIMMRGGVAVKSGDIILGAVGVSGAPGGDIDAACAQEALKSLEERLAFASMNDGD
ncbi:heme-binding protein [Sulfurimonas sp.]|uniref:GlcG/HbpS family heme-binding protein n=1 Tax=Sulfurimonas sp. TaxID=2022749 RepID=UPI0035671B69